MRLTTFLLLVHIVSDNGLACPHKYSSNLQLDNQECIIIGCHYILWIIIISI